MRRLLTRVPTPQAPADDRPPLTVREAAARLGRSEWWTRRYFKRVDGPLKMPPASGTRRGTRKYETIVIPADILERELQKFRIAS